LDSNQAAKLDCDESGGVLGGDGSAWHDPTTGKSLVWKRSDAALEWDETKWVLHLSNDIGTGEGFVRSVLFGVSRRVLSRSTASASNTCTGSCIATGRTTRPTP
jgi:hypothetical protein